MADYRLRSRDARDPGALVDRLNAILDDLGRRVDLVETVPALAEGLEQELAAFRSAVPSSESFARSLAQLEAVRDIVVARSAEVAGAVDAVALTAAILESVASGKQPIDDDLTAIAGQGTTAFGRGLLSAVDQLAAQLALGVPAAARVAILEALATNKTGLVLTVDQFPGGFTEMIGLMQGVFAMHTARVTADVNIYVPTDVATVQGALDLFARFNVTPGNLVKIRFPAGVITLTETLRQRSSQGAGLQLIGATRWGYSGTGVHSVVYEGLSPRGFKSWLVTLNVTPESGSPAVASISTDHKAIIRVAKGRRAWMVTGQNSVAAGASVITGVSSAFDNRYFGIPSRWWDTASYKQPTDVLIANQWARVDRTGTITGTSIPLLDPIPTAVTNECFTACFPEARGVGTISVTAGSNQMTGVGTSFLSTINPGDVIYADERIITEVVSVESDTSLTTRGLAPVSFSNRAFAIRNFYETLEGGFDIVAVDGPNSRVTVRMVSRHDMPPPQLGVSSFKLRVIRSVLYWPVNKSGVVLTDGERIGLSQDIAYVGSGAGQANITHAFSCGRDQDDSDSVISKAGDLRFDDGGSLIMNWGGSGLNAQRGADIQADLIVIAGCGSAGVAAIASGSITARKGIISNCNRGALGLNGASISLEDANTHSNSINVYFIDAGGGHNNGLRSLRSRDDGVLIYNSKGVRFNNAEFGPSLTGASAHFDKSGSGVGENCAYYAGYTHCLSVTGAGSDAYSPFSSFCGAATGNSIYLDRANADFPACNMLASRLDGIRVDYLSVSKSPNTRQKWNGGYGIHCVPNHGGVYFGASNGQNGNGAGATTPAPNAATLTPYVVTI